jgi:hypothetical protein
MPLLALLDGAPGAGSTLAGMYGRLLAVAAARPQAAVVRTEDGQVEQPYRDALR